MPPIDNNRTKNGTRKPNDGKNGIPARIHSVQSRTRFRISCKRPRKTRHGIRDRNRKRSPIEAEKSRALVWTRMGTRDMYTSSKKESSDMGEKLAPCAGFGRHNPSPMFRHGTEASNRFRLFFNGDELFTGRPDKLQIGWNATPFELARCCHWN